MPRDRLVKIRLHAQIEQFQREMLRAASSVNTLRKDIDTANDRTTWLAQGLLAIGPSLVPLGAGGVPVIAGLVGQMTAAALAGGTLALAFGGVGDALDALNTYQLEPTQANFQKMNDAMGKIGPAGEEFVAFLDEVGPKFDALRMLSREQMFPGVQAGIEASLELMPRFRTLVFEISSAIGDIATNSGEALAGPRFREFFDYLERTTKPLLMDMAGVLGNLAEGIGAMMTAFEPMTLRFSAGFEDMTRTFADWAQGLSTSSGFQEFVDYVNGAVPKALDFLAALAESVIAIIQAAAPIGDAMLPAFTQVLEVFTAIAESPIGPTIIGLTALIGVYGRTLAAVSLATGGMLTNTKIGFVESAKAAKAAFPDVQQWSTAMYRAGQSTAYQTDKTKAANKAVRDFAKAAAPAAGQAALMGIVMSDLDDKMGLTNTAMLGMIGMMVGPWGAAIGASAGLFMDLKSASGKAGEAITQFQERLDQMRSSNDLAGYAQTVKELRDQYNAMYQDINEEGASAFEKLANVLDPDTFVEGWRWILPGVEETLPKMKKFADDAAASFEDWEDTVTRVGTAMGLLETKDAFGNTVLPSLEDLQMAAQDLQPALDDLGYSWEELWSMDSTGLQTATAVIKEWLLNADSTEAKTDRVAAALSRVDAAGLNAAEAADELQSSMDELFGPKLGVSEATDNWIRGLKDFRKQLQENGGALVGNTREALDNRDAIRDLASDLQSVLVAKARKGKISADELSDGLKKMRNQLVTSADSFGVNKKQMENFLRQIGFGPKAISRLVESVKRGREKVDKLGGALDRAAGVYNIDVITTFYERNASASDFRRAEEDPDTAYRKPPPARGSRPRPSNVTGGVPYAATGSGRAARQSAGIDYDRLAGAMRNARPLYGDVKMQPHDYSQFKREMLADHQAAAIGGRAV